MIGERYGRWTVTAEEGRSRFGLRQVKCRCDCGAERVLRLDHIQRGASRSCGCYAKELTANKQRTHGRTNSAEYDAWCKMRSRCRNPNNKRYKHYGGRGIAICAAWESFQQFFADMGERPDGYSLERINVNGDYSPDNCCWVPMKRQTANRQNTVRIDGVHLAEFCRQRGLNYRQARRMRPDAWEALEALKGDPA